MTVYYKKQYKIVKFGPKHQFSHYEVMKAYREKNDKTLLISVPNTKYLTTKDIRSLPDDIKIRIKGPFTSTREKDYVGQIYTNKKNINEDNFYQVIYTKDEVIEILRKIENIINGINPYWSEIQKAFYVYDYLRQQILYDVNYKKDDDSNKIRSLKGLIYEKTVCAGYAVIFKEILNRLGIKCMYVQGVTHDGEGHAWNIIETSDGRFLPVDITWDNGNYMFGDGDQIDYFASNLNKFKRQHIPYKDEYLPKLKYSSVTKHELEEIKEIVSREQIYKQSEIPMIRRDMSLFNLTQIGYDNEKQYYRYIYQPFELNSKFNPIILVSREDLFELENEIISYKAKTKTTEEEDHRYILNQILKSKYEDIIFSEENIEDSLKRRTAYVGTVIENTPIEYEDLKNYLKNYYIEYEEDYPVVIDINTNEEVVDRPTYDKVIFSYNWLYSINERIDLNDEIDLDRIDKYKYLFYILKDYAREHDGIDANTSLEDLVSYIKDVIPDFNTPGVITNLLNCEKIYPSINPSISPYTYEKDEACVDEYKDVFKYCQRSDGSKFILCFLSNIKSNDNRAYDLNKYEIIEYARHRDGSFVLKKNIIFTENDLIYDDDQKLYDILLDRKRIDSKVLETGGYLGYMTDDGIKFSEPVWVEIMEPSNKPSRYKSNINTNSYINKRR